VNRTKQTSRRALYAHNSATRLAYEVRGDHGPPVVFVPGYLARRKIWALQASHLSRTRRVLLYDPRGVGDSDLAPDGYGLDQQMNDLIAVVDDVGWSRFDLVGHSMGGFLAMAFAIRHPHRVHRLGLLATAPYCAIEPDFGVGMFSGSEESEEGWDPAGIRRAVDLLLPEAGFSWLREQMTHSIPLHTLPRQARKAFGIYDQGDLRSQLREIECPSLVLHGDQDSVIDVGIGRKLTAAIPEAGFHRSKGLGHLMMITGAREVNGVLDEFLGDGRRVVSPSRGYP
jgi:3-oxoadipate enol-lactonase